MKRITLLFFCVGLLFVSCKDKYPDLPDGLYAEFITNQGTFVAKLYNEATPLTTSSFISLAQGSNELVDSIHIGKPFYNGLTFHRIIKDFMIQGGCPNGDGSGSPGYRFPDEFVDSLKHDKKGILSMANSGPETNGSQFFITLKETPWLDGKHTVFGEIVVGQDVVDSLGSVPTNKPGDKPVDPVILEEVNIVNKGKISIVDFATEMDRVERERKERQEKLDRIAINKAVDFVNMKAQADSLPSGLKMMFTERSNGRKPKEGEELFINYSGYFTNGQLFNTSVLAVAEAYEQVDVAKRDRGLYAPITTNTNDSRLIPGFREALQNMNMGDKVTVFIPSHLGYGEQGNRPYIPPNTDLIFELEMVEQE